MQLNTIDENARRKAFELFEAALTRPAEEREAFLAAACPQDAHLRAEVAKLVAADERNTDLVGTPVEAEAAAFCSSHTGSSTPRQIGPYRLFRKLGEGGMGTVYLAGRADGEFHHHVTIKLIKRGLDDENILRRFRRERRILASLHHPHIAQLLDGGTTDDGLPYFVMEYVKGETIDRYCNQRRLSIDARLQLFRKVCSAVSYAHKNQVVHRDIKPGNILVTEKGEPKLLDFGMAKPRNAELSAQTIALTVRDQMRFLTLPYASPEQIQGRQITPASDIYSLGVLLFELLSGHRPYQLEDRTRQDVEHVICEVEVPKPSFAAGQLNSSQIDEPPGPATVSRNRSTTFEGLRRKLAGDLDNIILKALRKEPQRRYSDAEELAKDIQRHQDDQPVSARPNTLRYRAGKFVRRHTWLVAFVASLLVASLSLAFLSASLIRQRNEIIEQRDQIAHQRDEVILEQGRAERISDFLVRIFQVSDPKESPGGNKTARELLEQAAAKITEDLEEQPKIKAKLMHTIGEAYMGLGLYESAAEMHLGALTARRSVWGQNHLEVAQSLNALALAIHNLEDYQRAADLLREALGIRRSLLDEDHPDIATNLNDLAEVLISLGLYQKAEELHRQALEIRQRCYGKPHPEIAESLTNLGWLLRNRGGYQEAERLLREGLEIRRLFFDDNHPIIANGLNNLGLALFEQGNYEAADPLFTESLEIVRQRFGDRSWRVAQIQQHRARLRQGQGRYQEAEQLHHESLGIWQQALGEDHSQVATAKIYLAELLLDKDDFPAAQRLIEEALQTYRPALGEDHWSVRYTESMLGACLAGQELYEAAERLLLGGYEVVQRKMGDRSPFTQEILEWIIDLYETWGRTEKAAAYRTLLDKSATPST